MTRVSIIAELAGEPAPADTASTAGMVTLIDLASLLLAFFVLSLSLSTYGPDHWQAAHASLARSFGPSTGVLSGALRQPASASSRSLRDPVYLATMLSRAAATDPSLQPIEVASVGNRVVLAISPQLVFFTHSGELLGEAMPILASVAQHLRYIPLPVTIAVETAVDGKDRWRPAIASAGELARALAAAGYGDSPTLLAIGSGTHPSEPSLSMSRVSGSDDEPGIVLCICEWP